MAHTQKNQWPTVRITTRSPRGTNTTSTNSLNKLNGLASSVTAKCTHCGYPLSPVQVGACPQCGKEGKTIAATIPEIVRIYGGTIEAVRSISGTGITNIALLNELEKSGYDSQDLSLLVNSNARFRGVISKLDEVITSKNGTIAEQNERLAYTERSMKLARNLTLLNETFQWRFKAGIFVLDIRLNESTASPCMSAENFTHKIAALAQVFDAPRTPLLQLIRNPETKKALEKDDSGTLIIMKRWAEERSIAGLDTVLDVWTNIRRLRTSYPIHDADAKAFDALHFFGEKPTSVDYKRLWATILDDFLETTDKFKDIMGVLTSSTGAENGQVAT